MSDVAIKSMDMAERAFRQRDALRKALDGILGAEEEFREGMPVGWEGDPLTDACDAARKVIAELSRC